MGLELLIARGVHALLHERHGELERVLGNAALAAGAGEALAALPTLLVGLNQFAWSEDASPRARAALSVVLAYGLKVDDLIPAHGHHTMLGVLDDAYLAFAAAMMIDVPVAGLAPEKVARMRDDLRAALPKDVTAELERMLDQALNAVVTAAGGA